MTSKRLQIKLQMAHVKTKEANTVALKNIKRFALRNAIKDEIKLSFASEWTGIREQFNTFSTVESSHRKVNGVVKFLLNDQVHRCNVHTQW